MNLTKEKVCVLIENEQQLQEARELLERHGERIDSDPDLFCLYPKTDTNHIYFHDTENMWMTYHGNHQDDETPITFSDLEKLLQNDRPIHQHPGR